MLIVPRSQRSARRRNPHNTRKQGSQGSGRQTRSSETTLFVRALNAGNPPNSELVGFIWNESRATVQAMVRHLDTGCMAIFEMDNVTGRPRFVSAVNY